MKILFLDDMEARHEAFQRGSIGHSVDHAYTAEGAIKLLEQGHYDAVCLDHDLADEHYWGREGKEQDGKAVARWIAEHKRPPMVWVHSFNADGSKAMCDIISGKVNLLYRAPFGPVSIDQFLLLVSKLPGGLA